jgi:hypothetical protein
VALYPVVAGLAARQIAGKEGDQEHASARR